MPFLFRSRVPKSPLELTLKDLINRLVTIQKTMSALSTELAAITTSLTSVASGIASLDAQIQAFQNSPGTLNPTDQASLDAIASASAALATSANAAVAAAPAPSA